MSQHIRHLFVRAAFSAFKPLNPVPVGPLLLRGGAIAFVPLILTMALCLLATRFPKYGDAFCGAITDFLATRLMLSMLVAGACLLPACLLLRWFQRLQRPLLASFNFVLAVAFNCATAIAGVAVGLLLPIFLAGEPLAAKLDCFIAIYCSGFLSCFLVVLAKVPDGKLDRFFGGRLWLRDMASILFAVLMAHAWMIDKAVR